MAAIIEVIGWPTGAEIFIDNKKIGELPIYNYILKWGTYKVLATKEGYEPEIREKFVVFPTDTRKTILIQLKKIGEEFGG